MALYPITGTGTQAESGSAWADDAGGRPRRPGSAAAAHGAVPVPWLRHYRDRTVPGISGGPPALQSGP